MLIRKLDFRLAKINGSLNDNIALFKYPVSRRINEIIDNLLIGIKTKFMSEL